MSGYIFSIPGILFIRKKLVLMYRVHHPDRRFSPAARCPPSVPAARASPWPSAAGTRSPRRTAACCCNVVWLGRATFTTQNCLQETTQFSVISNRRSPVHHETRVQPELAAIEAREGQRRDHVMACERWITKFIY